MARTSTCYIRRTDGAYRTINGWSHNRSNAFPYLANSGLLAWDVRDQERKGNRISVVDGDPDWIADAHGAPGENDPIDE